MCNRSRNTTSSSEAAAVAASQQTACQLAVSTQSTVSTGRVTRTVPVCVNYLHSYEILNHDDRQQSHYITQDAASMSSIEHLIRDTWYPISIGNTEQHPDNRKLHC